MGFASLPAAKSGIHLMRCVSPAKVLQATTGDSDSHNTNSSKMSENADVTQHQVVKKPSTSSTPITRPREQQSSSHVIATPSDVSPNISPQYEQLHKASGVNTLVNEHHSNYRTVSDVDAGVVSGHLNPNAIRSNDHLFPPLSLSLSGIYLDSIRFNR